MATAHKLPPANLDPAPPAVQVRFHLLDPHGQHLGWLLLPHTFTEAPRLLHYNGNYFIRCSRVAVILGGDEYKLAVPWDVPKTCDSAP